MPSPHGLEIVENCQHCKLGTGQGFCGVPSPIRDSLQRLGFATACPKGSVLIGQGKPAREIAILCAGHVKISTTSPAGKKICLEVAGPGTVLGLTAAILGTPHEVLIEAIEPCQLRIIKTDRLLALLRRDGRVCLAAIRSLSDEVRKMLGCVRLFGLSHSTAERLARVLVEWDIREDDERGELRLKIPLTHQELAEILGVARETVTRLLATFERKELIRCRGATLAIKDERTLRVLARTI